jgi:phosphopantetheinyl transferase
VKLLYEPLNGEEGHKAGLALLEQLYGGPLPEIRRTKLGKPYFVDSPLHFSISHTKRHAFCVLSDAPIGLDAEEASRRIDLRLAQKILSRGEKAQFDAAKDPREALLKFWVLKEAAAKYSGDGLRGYPNHTQFNLNDGRLQEIDGCFVAMIQEEDYAF